MISRDLLKQRHIKKQERFIARRFGVIVTPLSRVNGVIINGVIINGVTMTPKRRAINLSCFFFLYVLRELTSTSFWLFARHLNFCLIFLVLVVLVYFAKLRLFGPVLLHIFVPHSFPSTRNYSSCMLGCISHYRSVVTIVYLQVVHGSIIPRLFRQVFIYAAICRRKYWDMIEILSSFSN